MRAIAEELEAFTERIEGAWKVEGGPSGPVLAMTSPSTRHVGTVRRRRDQLSEQLTGTHPGHICANGPLIESPALGRMRRPDALVIPEATLDEEGFAVDATQVLAVIEIIPPASSRQRLWREALRVPGHGHRPLSGGTGRRAQGESGPTRRMLRFTSPPGRPSCMGNGSIRRLACRRPSLARSSAPSGRCS